MDTKSKAERALKILLDCNQRGIAGVADFLDIQEILQAYLTQCAEVERLKGLMLEQTKLNARVIKERDMWKEAADTTLQKYEAAMKKIDRALKDKQ